MPASLIGGAFPRFLLTPQRGIRSDPIGLLQCNVNGAAKFGFHERKLRSSNIIIRLSDEKDLSIISLLRLNDLDRLL